MLCVCPVCPDFACEDVEKCSVCNKALRKDDVSAALKHSGKRTTLT